MATSCISLLSEAEKLTLITYYGLRPDPEDACNVVKVLRYVASELLSRIVAVALLSLGAAIDFALHTALLVPTFVYAAGKSLVMRKCDFTLPWQHLQRVRNSVSAILFGSLFGLIHPKAGIVISEPTDKHTVIGILASNVRQSHTTPCSPLHSLEIISSVASRNRTHAGQVIYTDEQIACINSARSYEKSLERLQAQEYTHKITNTTLLVMSIISKALDNSKLSETKKHVLLRVSGLLIPILTAIDLLIGLIAQAFFLATGLVRLISGRGPLYTEVTTNPLMHIAFTIQLILKFVGNLLGTLFWFVMPPIGVAVAVGPCSLFFKMQLAFVMCQINRKMLNSPPGTRFALPILFGNGENNPMTPPVNSMHKTYLIVEKQADSVTLYWVNREEVNAMRNLTPQKAYDQIYAMLNARFPFLDIEKIQHPPVTYGKPPFEGEEVAQLNKQGTYTNCVVSNLFGMLEALDIINHNPEAILERNRVTREALLRDYSFCRRDCAPYTGQEEGFSNNHFWWMFQRDEHIGAPI